MKEVCTANGYREYLRHGPETPPLPCDQSIFQPNNVSTLR